MREACKTVVLYLLGLLKCYTCQLISAQSLLCSYTGTCYSPIFWAVLASSLLLPSLLRGHSSFQFSVYLQFSHQYLQYLSRTLFGRNTSEKKVYLTCLILSLQTEFKDLHLDFIREHQEDSCFPCMPHPKLHWKAEIWSLLWGTFASSWASEMPLNLFESCRNHTLLETSMPSEQLFWFLQTENSANGLSWKWK